jgi:hypothetical protein
VEQHCNENPNHKIIVRNEAGTCRAFIPAGVIMKLRLIALAILFVLATGSAFAHGNKVHLRGTVERIRADSLAVKTADGKTLEVKFNAATIFLSRSQNEDKPAKVGDLAVGDLVVIHATPKDSRLEADEVKFSVPSAAKPAMPASAKPKP